MILLVFLREAILDRFYCISNWSCTKLFDNVMIFWKNWFWKKSADDKKHAKFPWMQRANKTESLPQSRWGNSCCRRNIYMECSLVCRGSGSLAGLKAPGIVSAPASPAISFLYLSHSGSLRRHHCSLSKKKQILCNFLILTEFTFVAPNRISEKCVHIYKVWRCSLSFS